jgi:hypothetical protein
LFGDHVVAVVVFGVAGVEGGDGEKKQKGG